MKLFISVLISLFLFSCAGKKNKNDLTDAHLKGEVKIVTERTYYASGKPEAAQKDSLKYTTIYKYNKKGKQTEINTSAPHESATFTTKFIYDDHDNCIERDNHCSDGQIWKLINKYDDKGNLSESIFYNSNGKLSGKSTYIYNDAGKMLMSSGKNFEGGFIDTMRFRYFDGGSENYMAQYDSKGNLLVKDTSKFDSNGISIEQTSLSLDSNIYSKYIYIHNNDGEEIEEDTYTSQSPSMEKTIYNYENYDKNGNWLGETDIDDNKPVEITERGIDYYSE